MSFYTNRFDRNSVIRRYRYDSNENYYDTVYKTIEININHRISLVLYILQKKKKYNFVCRIYFVT